MKRKGKRYNRLLAGEFYDMDIAEEKPKFSSKSKSLKTGFRRTITKNEWLSDYYSE